MRVGQADQRDGVRRARGPRGSGTRRAGVFRLRCALALHLVTPRGVSLADATRPLGVTASTISRAFQRGGEVGPSPREARVNRVNDVP